MTPPSVDFSLLLATSIHDMKNTLGVLLSSLQDLREHQHTCDCSSDHLDTLQQQAEHIHNDLVRLLGLYSLQEERLSAHSEEHFVPDLLNDTMARYASLIDSQGLECYNIAAPLNGYFDRQLLASVLDNSLHNAITYARHRINLNAVYREGYLVISVHDDGPGFTNAVLLRETSHSLNLAAGNTQLGLYFAEAIAGLHVAGERQGFTTLYNGGDFGGAVFEIWLP